MHFDNAFARELPADPETGPRPRQVHDAAYSNVSPTPVAAPRLLAHSPEVAALLGLDEAFVASEQFAQVFGGNALLDGMQAIAANYGGHQFGHWAGQLGDGRAISLGEVLRPNGARWELQLKGAGPTPYSRTADGRAVLRSSVREFLCSEAMHHLGVPSTRALSLVGTGEQVVRDMFYDGHPRAEPGAIVCRVAPSFIRFGNFELPAARGESALLAQLVDFCIARDFPDIAGSVEQKRGEWFGQVCERTAEMIAHWMRVGFVHGVMNTDNMSILGLSIDYGPYGWIDDYDPDWTPNTTDAQGRRYRFGQQPQVAFWNLSRLAGALAALFEDKAVLQAGLHRYVQTWTALERQTAADKLGLLAADELALGLQQRLQALMQAGEVDMTIAYRALADLDPVAPRFEILEPAFYDPTKREALRPDFDNWLQDCSQAVLREARPAHERRDAMNAVNPRFVLRNYLAQQVIDRAEQGDESGISDLLEVMRYPYDDQPGREAFAARRPDWARDRAGCSMLSCSS